ncbi:MAG: DUF4760 domain-containing protein [Candidatus Eremiobacteraeota bacterium]|nr:DUF4760 domain-containing protein [Candidatus Eremiobacteraeota bacterium]MBV8222903.1 DUF4760 domain-containing protein [Candidatus Eremiobacteraeota bacterium]
MSPESITAIASVLTALIIGASAIAAVVQLRHMRASNQIAGFLTLRNMLDDDAHQAALKLIQLNGDLSQDDGYRHYVVDVAERRPEPAEQRYVDHRSAVVMMANAIEIIGTLVRNGIMDQQLFLQQYSGPIDGLWLRLEPYIALERWAHHDDAIWEDFEYLASRSMQWGRDHPSTFPSDAPRLLPAQAGRKQPTTAPAGLEPGQPG